MEIPVGFQTLDEQKLAQIEKWYKSACIEFITEKFGRIIMGADVHCLRTHAAHFSELWINDQIINHFMELLARRSNGNVQFIDSQFYPPYCKYGYKNVKSLTKQKNIFNYDMVLVPLLVNGNHWCLGVISPPQRHIQLYDSMRCADRDYDYVFEKLFDFLKDECNERFDNPLDTSEWIRDCVDDIPQQSNGFDCGVFVCVYAEYVTRNQYDINFAQEHIAYFRKKILFEICSGELLN